MAMLIDDSPNYFELRHSGALIALSLTPGDRPRIVHCGPDIPGAAPETLALLATRQHAPGGPASPLASSLLDEIGTGQPYAPGLLAHRAGKHWAIDLRVAGVAGGDASQPDVLVIDTRDDRAGIAMRHWLRLDPATGVLACRSRVENVGSDTLDLEYCAALCLPLDPRLTEALTFNGRWAGEFRTERFALPTGTFLRENRKGRTSHDGFPALILANEGTDESYGLAAGFHLAWSGNSRMRVDRRDDGSTSLQMGDLPLPGEWRLAPGNSYETPEMLACFSSEGLGDISRRFHRYCCDNVLDARTRSTPRPVHYNTWEAVYFDHDEATVIDLAERAAAVGAERFVLDDGWFGGRRSDAAGLGDWTVSRDIFPDGLHALAGRVRELGMEFGLWVEPEMVNPDSDLFRAHPDWVLGVDDVVDVPSRNQLALDLTRGEVSDYLFEAISALVAAYSLDYIKWDMNRDIPFPGTHAPDKSGMAVMHQQVRAWYALLDRLRDAHPALEIESCASGGGRADFGALRHADRVWTSDNNDARERQAIQRGVSHFLPLRALGSHVGPAKCHITGRRLSMELRVASAMFGHMGLELDLRAEEAGDLAVLEGGIALHKRHRALIHEGEFYRLEAAANVNAVGCVAQDRSEALFSYAVVDSHRTTHPARLRLAGLDPAARYRVQMVWPQRNPAVSSPSIADELIKGLEANGAALMGHGLQPPLTHPDTCMIFHLEAAV